MWSIHAFHKVSVRSLYSVVLGQKQFPIYLFRLSKLMQEHVACANVHHIYLKVQCS